MSAGTSDNAVFSLPERPAFGRHLSAIVIPGEGVALRGERTIEVLATPLYERLAPLLDGSHSTDEIVDLLEKEHDAAEVYYAIATLATEGHVVDAASRADHAHGAFWDSLEGGIGAKLRLRASTIAVRGDSSAGWTDALAALGFTIADEGDVVIQVVSDYRDSSLPAWNERALAERRPWLLVRASSTRAWIGPFFRPGEGPCWQCLRHRLDANDAIGTFLRRRHHASEAMPSDAAPWTSQTVVGLVAGALTHALTSQDRWRDASITILDTLTLDTARHRVARRPECPACGNPKLYGEQVLSPFRLQSVSKGDAADGGHRTVSAERTVARLGHLIDPVTGIVTDLHRSTPDDSVLHVYTAGANPVFLHHDLSGLRAGLRRASSGKGFSDAQARASALGEALERYSASSHGDEPRRLATVGEMRQDGGIDPRDVMLYSKAQYAARKGRSNGGTAVHDWVPEPIDESTTLEWSPVWSLTEDRIRYLPTALLYIGHRGQGASHCHGDSNGCAAGNTKEEALLQGLCELVERDAVAMWWYNRVSRPALELSDFDGAEWDRIRAHYGAEQRDLWLLDVTNDLGVPTIVAVSRYRDRAEEEVLVGLGTHLDVEVAAMRAVSEMNQMFAALDIMRQKSTVNPALGEWLSTATVANQPYLAPRSGPATRRTAFARVTSSDVADDIGAIQRTIESKGMSLLVCDQTRAEVGLPVGKAIAPGLRHFRQRFAPGRLYEVPVSLGWRSTPCQEPELNPIAFFL